MSEYKVYNLEVQANGLVVDVTLGGARVYFEGEGRKRFTQKKLNPWLLDGKNLLEARLGLPAKSAGGGERAFRARVIQLRAGQDWPEPSDELMVFAWRPDVEPLPDEGMATVLSHELSLGAVHGRWAWQDAAPFEPSERPAVLALVAALHQALAARDLDTVLAQHAIRNDEVARALGGARADLESDMREHLRTLFAAKDWRMAPAGELELVPSAGGRLVEVVALDGGAPLRGRGGEDELELGLTVSRLATGWTIVR